MTLRFLVVVCTSGGLQFPEWLAANESKLPKDQYDAYGKQFQCFQKLVNVYETTPDDFPKLMELMQDVRGTAEWCSLITQCLAVATLRRSCFSVCRVVCAAARDGATARRHHQGASARARVWRRWLAHAAWRWWRTRHAMYVAPQCCVFAVLACTPKLCELVMVLDLRGVCSDPWHGWRQLLRNVACAREG